MLSVTFFTTILSVVMLSVVMLSVVAPFFAMGTIIKNFLSLNLRNNKLRDLYNICECAKKVFIWL